MSMAYTANANWDDLNVATAAMQYGKVDATVFSISPEMVFAFLVMPLLVAVLWQLTTEQTRTWKIMSDRISSTSATLRSVVAQFLVYSLSGITSPMKGFQAGPPKFSTKGRLEMDRGSNRRTFMLESRLDSCQLEPKPARRRSMATSLNDGPNTILQATLDPPVIDLPWITGSSPALLEALDERINSLSDLVADISSRRSSSEAPPTAAQGQTRRRAGAKPKIKNMRDTGNLRESTSPVMSPEATRAMELGHSGSSLQSLTCSDSSASFGSTSDEDSDWEDEPRAEVPESGDAMDGLDVGCPPTKVTYLPRAQVAYTVLPVWGRSIFQSDWEIPKKNVEDFKSTVEEFLTLAVDTPQEATTMEKAGEILLLDKKGMPTKTLKKPRVRGKKIPKEQGTDENKATEEITQVALQQKQCFGDKVATAVAQGPGKQGFGHRRQR